jgi:anti-sigma B factor antagonist
VPDVPRVPVGVRTLATVHRECGRCREPGAGREPRAGAGGPGLGGSGRPSRDELEAIPIDERDFAVALTGEVDLYTGPELKQELLRLVEEGAHRIIVDLTDTTFIDSTMLSVLLSAVKRLRPSGGQLGIVCTDRNIRKIFEITLLLDRVFPIFRVA